MTFLGWFKRESARLHGIHGGTVDLIDGIAPALLGGVIKFGDLEFLVDISGGLKSDKRNARKIWAEYIDAC